MSNTPAKRPSTARTRTPKDEVAREQKLDESFSVSVDGEVYTLVMADMTGLAEMKIRRETGMAVAEIISRMESSPGIDLVGCFMFACEIASGKKADLEQILGSISWASPVDIVDAEGNPVPQP